MFFLLQILQIGNAVINDKTDNQGMYDFLASHAIISDEAAHDITKYCNFSAINQTSECNAAVDEASNDTSFIDIYNIYAALCKNPNLTTHPKKNSVRFKFKPFFVSNTCLQCSLVFINFGSLA